MQIGSKLIFKFLRRCWIWYQEKNKDEVLSNLKFAGNNISLQNPFHIVHPENVSIGSNSSFAGFLHIWGNGGVIIGENCMIGSHSAITSTTHNPQSELFNSQNIHAEVIIGNNVWIGSHCVIFPGVKIEDNVIIGAGSIVNRNLKSNHVYAGVPAKLLYKLSR